MNETCLILGGAGFIGSHLADSLLHKGYQVVIFDRINCFKGNINHIIKKIKFIEGDFNNEIDLKNALKGVDYVYHFVSTTLPQSSNLNPFYDVESNVLGSIKLFEECVSNSIKKVIFLSSGGTVYGIPKETPIKETHGCNPLCSYGITKIAIEKYLNLFNYLYGLDYSVIRLSNPYGERQNPNVPQGVISVFLKKVFTGETIEIWGDGSVIRDYIYISDVSSALVSVIQKYSDEKTFNVSSCNGYSLKQIIACIENITNRKAMVNYTNLNRKFDVSINLLDNSLFKKEFNWLPVISLEDGIEKTWNWIKNQKF
jgi:UDP-glucose 4-epimerase